MHALAIPDSWRECQAVANAPELQQDRAFQTRAQILEAAAELFAVSGFAGTSLKQVAEGAGVTKGALYFHYQSKERLAAAVVAAHYARWPRLLEAMAGSGFGPFDTAIELLNRAALAFRDDVIVRGGARLQIERSLIAAPLPLPYVGWTQVLTELLTQAEEMGQLRPGVDPASSARILVSSFFGMQHVSETLHDRGDIVERWQDMCDVFVPAWRA